MHFFYNIIIHCFAPVFLWIARRHCHSHPLFKLPNCWQNRRAINLPLKSGGIVVHAVSAGETRSSFSLLKEIAQNYPTIPITLTNGSLNGAEQAYKFKSDFDLQHCMLCLDYPIYVKRFLKQLAPKVLIVMETEIWPNLYYYCEKMGVKIILLNMRLTESSYKNYQRFSAIIRTLNRVSLFGMQSERDKLRLIDLGVEEKKIVVMKSLKSNLDLPEKFAELSSKWRNWVKPKEFCWVAGSIHKAELSIMLETHINLIKQKPNSLLILAPRQPQEFVKIKSVCENVGRKHQLITMSFSEWSQCEQEDFRSVDIFIIDRMGELLSAYTSADVAFVGGSLCDTGGHNILEPAILKKPVLSGPSYFDQKPLYEIFLVHQAITICTNAKELLNALLKLADPCFSDRMARLSHQCAQKMYHEHTKEMEAFWITLARFLSTKE